jgi:hypothetical protein
MSLKTATEKQIEYGKILNLNLELKSFRVAGAMIADEVESRCLKSVQDQELKKGDRVKYTGNYPERKNRTYIVNSVGKSGLVYFFVKDEFGNKKSSYAYAYYLKKIRK